MLSIKSDLWYLITVSNVTNFESRVRDEIIKPLVDMVGVRGSSPLARIYYVILSLYPVYLV